MSSAIAGDCPLLPGVAETINVIPVDDVGCAPGPPRLGVPSAHAHEPTVSVIQKAAAIICGYA